MASLVSRFFEKMNMIKEWHEHRNENNQCPETEPQPVTPPHNDDSDPVYIDSTCREWHQRPFLLALEHDAAWNEGHVYTSPNNVQHGDFLEGEYECSYDAKGNLLPADGTYNFASNPFFHGYADYLAHQINSEYMEDATQVYPSDLNGEEIVAKCFSDTTSKSTDHETPESIEDSNIGEVSHSNAGSLFGSGQHLNELSTDNEISSIVADESIDTSFDTQDTVLSDFQLTPGVIADLSEIPALDFTDTNTSHAYGEYYEPSFDESTSNDYSDFGGDASDFSDQPVDSGSLE